MSCGLREPDPEKLSSLRHDSDMAVSRKEYLFEFLERLDVNTSWVRTMAFAPIFSFPFASRESTAIAKFCTTNTGYVLTAIVLLDDSSACWTRLPFASLHQSVKFRIRLAHSLMLNFLAPGACPSPALWTENSITFRRWYKCVTPSPSTVGRVWGGQFKDPKIVGLLEVLPEQAIVFRCRNRYGLLAADKWSRLV